MGQIRAIVAGLHHSSQQHGIFNPLSEARDRTHILMDTGQVLNSLNHNGNSNSAGFFTPSLCFLPSLSSLPSL